MRTLRATGSGSYATKNLNHGSRAAAESTTAVTRASAVVRADADIAVLRMIAARLWNSRISRPVRAVPAMSTSPASAGSSSATIGATMPPSLCPTRKMR